MKVKDLQEQVCGYERTTQSLSSRLDLLNSTNSAAEKRLQQFYRKLGRIRVALAKEVEKVRN